jgi:hypothetical protein
MTPPHESIVAACFLQAQSCVTLCLIDWVLQMWWLDEVSHDESCYIDPACHKGASSYVEEVKVG